MSDLNDFRDPNPPDYPPSVPPEPGTPTPQQAPVYPETPDVVERESVLENEGGTVAYTPDDDDAASEPDTATPADALTADMPAAEALISPDAARVESLTRYIERYPNTPTNYILRGEVYLTLRQAASAAADFRRALDLAEAHSADLSWGYANAAFIDRAAQGLRRAQQHG